MNKSLGNLTKTLAVFSHQQNGAIASIHTSSRREKVLNTQNMNANIKEMQYAVRGPIVLKAGQIEDKLERGEKMPFDKIIRANIGDCHATGQKPITFLRQLMAIVTLPELLNDPNYPDDVKEKARLFLADCKGNSIGSYTESEGLKLVRKQTAKFIEKRDGGVASNWENIYLTLGASDAIKSIMEILLTNTNEKQAGFLIPIPQYPFYSASIQEFNAKQIGYYLNEDDNWSLEISELQKAYDQAVKTCIPRALVVINPGNPTGQLLSKENIKEIIKWARANNLFILADEVYQDNIYVDGSKFHSFKKCASELGSEYSTEVEIASFYSTSKGYMGECGVRSGFMEVVNLDPFVKLHLDKLASVRLCSSSVGQACMYGVVNPPVKGDQSYELFSKEKEFVLNGLKEKAKLVSNLFNSMKGIKCNELQGAMYAFPRIDIPRKAIEYARSINMEPDVYYGFELLDKTGICIVPGSGFLQRPNTYHFRTTILPPIDQIKSLLGKFEKFHTDFLNKWDWVDNGHFN